MENFIQLNQIYLNELMIFYQMLLKGDYIWDKSEWEWKIIKMTEIYY